MLNKSLGDFAYTLININADVPLGTLERIRSIDGVLSTRVIYQHDI
jgi:D-3-phosphoglycerate dehydrogenase